VHALPRARRENDDVHEKWNEFSRMRDVSTERARRQVSLMQKGVIWTEMTFVNRTMRRLILSSALVSVLCFPAASVLAQVYKWVDEKGVVNYSSEAPADRKVTQLDPKAARVSIIGTDDPAKRTATGQGSMNERVLSEKIDRLERKLDEERYARRVADAQAQTAADSWYQQCLRDRRVDCDYAGMDPYYGYGPNYGYWPVVAVKRHPLRDHVMHHGPAPAPKPAGGRASFAPKM
jgi:hypothetical protein